MQRVTLVRYTAKPDRAEENQALSLAVFSELKITKPEHVAYAVFRDGADFVHLFVNLREDDSAAVTELPRPSPRTSMTAARLRPRSRG